MPLPQGSKSICLPTQSCVIVGIRAMQFLHTKCSPTIKLAPRCSAFCMIKLGNSLYTRATAWTLLLHWSYTAWALLVHILYNKPGHSLYTRGILLGHSLYTRGILFGYSWYALELLLLVLSLQTNNH